MTRFSRRCVILVLLLVSCMFAQDATPSANAQSWRGTWAARVGPRIFHGRWWAQPLPKQSDAASGSWTLLSDSNQIVLEGTWSARKFSTRWQGTWSARVGSGKSFSGTWTADMTESKTFADMLKQTLEKQVTGSWRSGRMQGNWWLMGPG